MLTLKTKNIGSTDIDMTFSPRFNLIGGNPSSGKTFVL